MRRQALLAALVLGLAIAAPHRARAEAVSVGTIGTITDCGFFIADKLGYFKDEGLQVSFIQFDNAGKMIPALGRGQLDVGSGAVPVGLYNAVERGIGIKIVADKARNAPGYNLGSLLVRKALVDGGQVKTLKDLRGLRVAIVNKGNSEESLLSRVLAKAGLGFADIKLVYLPFVEQPSAYRNGAIDASVTAEPTVTAIVETGAAVRFAPESEFEPDGVTQSAVTLFGAPFIKDQPDAARKFLRALVRAFRFYRGALKDGHLAGPNADRVIAIMVQYSKFKDPQLFRKIGMHAVDPNGEVDIAALQRDWRFFKDTGQIDGSVTVADVVDLGFVKAAAASLGPYRGP